MTTPLADSSRGRVVLLEPNAALRSALVTLLHAEQYDVVVSETFEDAQQLADAEGSVALVAWQSMQGLLAEERRASLLDITRRVRLVVMVPRQWARLLEGTDLTASVAAIIAKPFQADDLLSTLNSAFAVQVELKDSVTS